MVKPIDEGFPPEVQTALDQGLINYAMARAATSGAWDQQPASVQSASKGVVRRPSRRGGRSYNEGSESECDPYWSDAQSPISNEQQIINRAGIALVRKSLDEGTKPNPI